LFVLENNFVMLESSTYGLLLISDHLLLWLKNKLPYVMSESMNCGPHINPFLIFWHGCIRLFELLKLTWRSLILHLIQFKFSINPQQSPHKKDPKSDNWQLITFLRTVVLWFPFNIIWRKIISKKEFASVGDAET
jgi:hypothetical protein